MGLLRRDAPDTSVQAEQRNLPREGTQRWRVLLLLQAAHPDGLTDEEMQTQLGMNANTQRPRRVELVRDGWLEDSGYRRPTRGGDPAIVWRYVPDRIVEEPAEKPAQGVLF